MSRKSDARSSDDALTALGHDVRGPVDQLETFAAPASCTRVRFTSDELTSVCPVTGQPDFSSVEIDYQPNLRCIESKSLKLYLWSFRDRAAFCEQLAADIAAEVQRAAQPLHVRVTVTQHTRGGIVTEATAELS
ncbi:MAG TPA: preQ(1) synthase [Acidimicrobiales bacterium]|nr:preQ(1) synthase [Acidimicrobiales bacterium]